ncbi:N-acetylmuramoyl-L-alanine amidase LytC [Caldalkalibacillus thermarum]|uniref:cell wall-binding repeat-containing protein n=1 Tax=Caldalkalibacillus thermarum TaxID=296745 RepID=UPI00166ADE3B|nr:cell wall-binding repeat-containing protein [Caldalkalibacillus thermarum]GGK28981.1 N-acetylmuramoyl-L-alanine amidase LytC [Caldalkalibacillus thermarum]
MSKRLHQFVLLLLVFCLIGSLLIHPLFIAEANSVEVQRIQGTDRFATAVEISKSWNRSDTVILARGDVFADALAGTPLAYLNNAPILLTWPNELPKITADEIKRLKAKEVIVLGGTGAISRNVENKLEEEMELTVRRLEGDNRYQTALKIAEEMRGIQGVNTETAIIASGENFPDALAIAPYAARQRIPILLTQRNTLPEETRHYVQQVNKTIVIGGTAVISEDVRKQLPGAQRIAGSNRYETSVKVIEELNMPKREVMVASGVSFADALTGSVLAAKRNMPVLLTEPNRLNAATQYFVNKYAPSLYIIIGGQAAITNSVVLALQGIEHAIKIFIDPGHGGRDSGAVGNGLREKDLTLEIALMVRDILVKEYSQVEVKMSRETDTFISLSDRAAMANNWGADYFVSIHHNAGGGTGFESFVHNRATNPVTHEKRAIVHDHIVQSLSKYNVRDRGKKAANFAVLRETRMPAVLLELLFIDNANDAKLLKDPQFKKDLARAVAEGIAKAWNLPKK